jgi:hypothetical protein
MSNTRKFATSIAGTVAGLAGLTLALVPVVAITDSSDQESATSQVADSVGSTSDVSGDDSPWN